MMYLNAEYFYVLFNKHCKPICSLSFLKLYQMLVLRSVLLAKSGVLYPLKQKSVQSSAIVYPL